MTLAADIANDYLIFDGNTSDITLHQIRPDGRYTVSVSNVVDSPLTRRQMAAMQGGLTGKERHFSLNASQVGSQGVEVGDKIEVSSGNVWIVIQSGLATLDSRWTCICHQQE